MSNARRLEKENPAAGVSSGRDVFSGSDNKCPIVDARHVNEALVVVEHVADGTIVTGQLVGFFSALLATKLPGPGAVARSIDVRFKAPARPGDDVRIEVKIVGLVPRIRKAVLEGRDHVGDRVLLHITAESLLEE